VFVTTHWSAVMLAGSADSPAAQAALEQLCRVYWYPLYAHVRRRGYSAPDALRQIGRLTNGRSPLPTAMELSPGGTPLRDALKPFSTHIRLTRFM
jgi:hypothetical protein